MVNYNALVAVVFLISYLIYSGLASAFGTKPIPVVSPSPIVNVSPSPSVEFYCENCTAEETRKVNAGQFIANTILQSKCFRDFLLERKMIQTNSRTNAQVLSHLESMDAKVPVRMYYKEYPKGKAVVGFRQPPSLTIHLNRFIFTPKTNHCDWTSVLAHEAYGHSVGNYGHDFNRTDRRPYSVPYSLNRAVEKCCRR